jgi:hypothetical protein
MHTNQENSNLRWSMQSLRLNLAKSNMVKKAKIILICYTTWRYAPKFENGVPVVAENLKVRLDFKLAK